MVLNSHDYPPKQGLYLPEFEKAACGVGFVVKIDGQRSHQVVSDSLTMLLRMKHRGACGCEDNTGDGAGIMTAIPHEMYQNIVREEGHSFVLPGPGQYATGLVFLDTDSAKAQEGEELFKEVATNLGIKVLGWREVPFNNSTLGPTAAQCQPYIKQVFVTSSSGTDLKTFRKLLFMLRKIASNTVCTKNRRFYICSLSADVMVYKGMFTAEQLSEFFVELLRPDYSTHFAVIHSRFSTNTFPSWERAHPNRYLAHNGEINTVRGNVNNMRAREGVMASQYIGDSFKKLYPAIEENLTDSGCFDNALELLIMAGSRSLPEAMMTMVPEAWQNDSLMSEEKRNFYKWSSCSMEPWDGPALFTFSDGRYVGAILDRNGLRPCRYYVTQQGCVMMASEVGVDTFSDDDIIYKGRLKPGRMLLVDTEVGEIVKDDELKHQIATLRPTGQWLQKGLVTIKDLERSYLETNGLISGSISLIQSTEKNVSQVDRDHRMTLFGYSVEDLSMLIVPMIRNRKEALGSMGNDTPLACLSSHPQMVFDYFKQLFAQVTNPPIDPIREMIVMSLACPIGPEGNLLAPGPNQCNRLYLEQPILTCADVQVMRECVLPQWKCKTLDIVYPVTGGVHGLVPTLDKLCEQASNAVEENYAFILLTDKKAGPNFVPVSSLLALGAVHQHLIKTKQRRNIGILVESGEVREVHHICALLGYGGDAVCPYFMFEIISNLRKEGLLDPPLSDEEIVDNYIAAARLGISKVMAKMGISTLHSYKGAQIFEAVGLDPTVVDKCFTGTASRLNGVTFEILAQEALDKHSVAFSDRECDNVLVNNRGDYHWRDGGEKHTNDPQSIANLQAAAKNRNQIAYQRYVQSSNQNVRACTLRGQLTFKFQDKPLDLSEVEPASEIVKRFCTGAMSFGSISIETHTTLAIAMNRIGGKSNTGEGGEDPNRALEESRSAIKQVASGRFGVTGHYLASADELQIKMAQGAKPGEGGELPGHKISHEIAKTRKSVKGVGLISPPPHHDIYSIEDLAELIYNLKCANPEARVSVKLVSEVGVGIVASGVAKAKAEHIVVSGHDGGTGASTWTGVKHAGLPWELGLAETHQTLVLNDLRRRVILQTDGQMKTGRDVMVAALLGADEYGFSTAPLIALGCTMMRKCHLNTCPVGIATQDPVLRKKFEGKPEHVINYMFMVAEEVREYMSKLGFRKVSDMIGRCDMLMPDAKQLNHKSKLLDFAAILTPSNDLRPGNHAGGSEDQYHSLDKRKDNYLIKAAHDVLKGVSDHVYLELPIQNVDRAFGTTLSVHHISRVYGEEGLKDGLIHIKVKGSAGQSFGAFLTRGIKLELEGDANDYVGKGLCGATLVAYPSHKHGRGFKAEHSVIVGNTCLYGGTSGKAFFRGITGERFCVRNSGVIAVSEGVGDHCCEYMTGGTTVVLGPTGRNFAAGMSGGVAFVWDPDRKFPSLCNKEGVNLEEVLGEDDEKLRRLVEEHQTLTQSAVAENLLRDWKTAVTSFVKVIPTNYKKALARIKEEEEEKKLQKEISVDKKEEKNEASPPLIKKESSEPSVADIEEMIPDSTMEQQIIDRVLDKTRGFVKYARSGKPYRSAKQRIKDWKEIYNHRRTDLKVQTARCMDCGVPFCQSNTGCPLGNIIPKWNDLIFKDQWQDALHSLLLTNNFPEFTGRVCPAPCEGACVLSINSLPVTIKKIECSIIDHAFDKGWITPQIPSTRTGRKVAVIGSGPAGMAAASQLNKAGHLVTVFEKNDRCGGLLMYGIPSMKLDKKLIQRRIDLMVAEGISFKTSVEVGRTISSKELLAEHDAVLLSVGSSWPRDLPIPGRNLAGIHFAMNFLETSQKRQMGNVALPPLEAAGKHVIVIGGGDTGVDCIGTSLRQDAKSITTFELLEEPPRIRQQHNNPWPSWPRVFRVEYGHEEVAIKYGRDPRIYNTMSKEFISNKKGHVTGIRTVEVKWVKNASGRWEMVEIADSEKVYAADLVLIALGFLGPEKALAKHFGVKLDPRSNFSTKKGEYRTSAAKVYAAGDCRFGQSLVVTAIAEGRQAARQIDLDLMGTTSLAGPGGVIHATHPSPDK